MTKFKNQFLWTLGTLALTLTEQAVYAASVEMNDVSKVTLYSQQNNSGTYIMVFGIEGTGRVQGKNGQGQEFMSNTVPISIPVIRIMPPAVNATAKVLKNHEMTVHQIKECEKMALLASASNKLKFIFSFDDGSWNGQDKCAKGFRCNPLDDNGNSVDPQSATRFDIGGTYFNFTLNPNENEWPFTFACSISKK